MNRHWQLVQTFAANCRCVEALQGRVEWVIANIRRTDDVSGQDWAASDALIRREGAALLERGLLRYYTSELPEWNAGWVKNIAAFMATGSFLINLDIDNYISIPDTMRLLKLDLNATLYHGFNGQWGTGTYGMIGMSRPLFYTIGGYREDFVGFGCEDFDLLRRAEIMSKLPIVQFCSRKVILNDDADRIANVVCVSGTVKDQNVSNRERCMQAIAQNKLHAENTVTRALTIRDHMGVVMPLNSM